MTRPYRQGCGGGAASLRKALLSAGWRCIDEPERALYWALEARSLLSAVADSSHPTWSRTSDDLGRAIHPSAQYARCEEVLRYFDEALLGYLSHGNGEEASVMRLEIAECLWLLGQLEGALEHARLATAYWREHEPAFTMFQQSGHMMVGYLLAELGRIDEARAEYEHLLAIVDLDSSEVMREKAKRALEQLPRRGREPEAR